MKLCGGAELVDGQVEETKGVAKRMREVVGGLDEGG